MSGRFYFACSWGSFELKRCYQKNLGWGITLAALLHIIVIGGSLVYSNTTTELTTSPPQPPHTPVDTIVINLTPPPPIGHDQTTQINVATQFEDIIKSIGIPNPVPDEVAPKDRTIPTQDELSAIADQSAQKLLGSETSDSIVIKAPPKEYLPPPGKYVHREEEPVPINEVKPEYPPLARQAGIEGVVFLEVLVDKNGEVRDARITKPSGAGAGFEEEAIKAAYQTKWKPAISNNQPVAVRVTYPVHFKLK
jgi:protein TonB